MPSRRDEQLLLRLTSRKRGHPTLPVGATLVVARLAHRAPLTGLVNCRLRPVGTGRPQGSPPHHSYVGTNPLSSLFTMLPSLQIGRSGQLELLHVRRGHGILFTGLVSSVVGWAKRSVPTATIPIAAVGTLRFAHPTVCAAVTESSSPASYQAQTAAPRCRPGYCAWPAPSRTADRRSRSAGR